MKYDIMHLPGPPINGCGITRVSQDISEDHERGDRINIYCWKCGQYGEHEIRHALKGLENDKD
jgi:hypothetical protein